MATEPQKKKFAQFVDSELKDDCVDFLNQLIKVAGLSLDELGTIWGVTVCVDKQTLLRVNVANWEFASVRLSANNSTGTAQFSLIGRPKITLLMPLSTRFTESSLKIEDLYAIWINVGRDSKRILSNQNVANSARKAVEAMMAERRGLPNPNWHNPLINSLITAT